MPTCAMGCYNRNNTLTYQEKISDSVCYPKKKKKRTIQHGKEEENPFKVDDIRGPFDGA